MNKTITTLFLLATIMAFSQEATKDTIEQAKEIQETIIKSQRKKQFADKAVYIVTNR